MTTILRLAVLVSLSVALALPATADDIGTDRFDVGRVIAEVLDFFEVLILGDELGPLAEPGGDELGPYIEPSGDDGPSDPDELGPYMEPGG